MASIAEKTGTIIPGAEGKAEGQQRMKKSAAWIQFERSKDHRGTVV